MDFCWMISAIEINGNVSRCVRSARVINANIEVRYDAL